MCGVADARESSFATGRECPCRSQSRLAGRGSALGRTPRKLAGPRGALDACSQLRFQIEHGHVHCADDRGHPLVVLREPDALSVALQGVPGFTRQGIERTNRRRNRSQRPLRHHRSQVHQRKLGDDCIRAPPVRTSQPLIMNPGPDLVLDQSAEAKGSTRSCAGWPSIFSKQVSKFHRGVYKLPVPSCDYPPAGPRALAEAFPALEGPIREQVPLATAIPAAPFRPASRPQTPGLSPPLVVESRRRWGHGQ